MPPQRMNETKQSDGYFEIREYPALKVVSTANDTDDSSFMRLIRYIGGANQTKEKLSMTTPVIMEKGQMNFVLPKDHQANPPTPNAAEVKVSTLPARRVAVYRFSGTVSRNHETAALAKLKTWILAQKLHFKDDPTIAYYDGPFTLPALRRNEVMLPVAR